MFSIGPVTWTAVVNRRASFRPVFIDWSPTSHSTVFSIKREAAGYGFGLVTNTWPDVSLHGFASVVIGLVDDGNQPTT